MTSNPSLKKIMNLFMKHGKADGSLQLKTPQEAMELIELVANNQYMFTSDRSMKREVIPSSRITDFCSTPFKASLLLEDKQPSSLVWEAHSSLDMASSSSDILDAHCFRTQYHQDLFEEHLAKKSVTLETCFELQEDEYPEIQEKIAKSCWRRLSKPRTKISKVLIQEFYANVIARKPSSFFFLNTRAIPASEPDQVVSLYEWISFPRRSVDQTIFGFLF
ncbi:hypothetical protein PIB30_098384 [Stylosanthes scabra]|uniref:Uncharacterized protein n=1 Tax=Stylosanthes scabra TaxID=79078 RepID=A0ABU6XW65_9FABA|nr:hypothetical protein [Stylosanthes scabra]